MNTASNPASLLFNIRGAHFAFTTLACNIVYIYIAFVAALGLILARLVLERRPQFIAEVESTLT